MLRDLLFKGKEIADKVSNIMMNYTDVELKVREATNDEICFPHGHLLQKLADYTYAHETCLEVMSNLLKRMHSDNRCSWRRVYKSLIVLAFLLRNGSDYLVQGARDHIYDIRTLESFRFFDENGKDQGMNVRIKVQEVIDLLQDPDKLQQERQKAKANRHCYIGFGNTSNSDWGYSSYRNSGDYCQRSISLDNCDRETYTSKNIMFQSHAKTKQQISEHASNLPPPRLGSFDDWHVGKERGVMDDVLEQFKEAWDLAKESTKDLIFSKKPQDTRSNEFNPRMVSEEVYEFPPNAVESSGTYETRMQSSYGGEYSVQNKFSTTSISKSVKFNHHNSHVNNINSNNNSIHASQSSGKSVDSVIVTPRNQSTDKKDNTKPRPPSCDLLDSFGDSNTARSNQMVDLFDTICSSTTPSVTVHSQQSQQQQPIQTCFEVNWPENPITPRLSLNTNPIQNHATVPCQNHDDLLDSEFGDFTSAAVIQSPTFFVTTGSTLPSSPLFDSIPFSNTSNNQFHPSKEISLQNKQTEGSEPYQQQPQEIQSNPTSPSKSKQLNIGSTWKELDSLSIDLDSLIKPEKYSTRAHAPSLHQLKQNQQQQHVQ
ncbi:Clathrin interactor 1 isoform 2 [Schistosoma japonicum]|uniref:Clathrin interactor 1 isoform 2 n=1 Tax=Schistosoma japonicum TaxID=6182 RepID=A0A4Z2DW55_SCHJA|nr:Clathrin interactor 1 [Schistosoma japonicum]TNN20717.1 Clathrin interactor 1 isoform 2 [Schistosoma japonicum]